MWTNRAMPNIQIRTQAERRKLNLNSHDVVSFSGGPKSKEMSQKGSIVVDTFL